MKLYYTNLFFVGFPTILGILGFMEPSLWAIAALFSIITGAFQVVVGLGLWNDSGYKDIYLTSYVCLTALFFILWIITDWEWIWLMPPTLALYLTLLIYNDYKRNCV